jgi:CheY-like chemotaxis protein
MTSLPLQILVVEDNQGARQLVCEMLAMLGYRADSVATAEEAVEPIKSGAYNVLLSDISLPGMSGIALAEMAVANVPDIKIVFASGYGYLVADKTDFEFILLPKPYDLNQLEHVIERLISTEPLPPGPQ